MAAPRESVVREVPAKFGDQVARLAARMLQTGTMNEAPRQEDLASLLKTIAARKEWLDKLRPLSPEALSKLDHYHNIELTYASNAIEGNTLSPVETTLVIEQGITIGGKPLKDHLEALDHYDAMRYVRELGRQTAPLMEGDIRNLHSLVVQRSRPDIAGRYADLSRYVRTESGRHTFPSPIEIPALMRDFAAWLGGAPDTPDTAFTAHRRLVDIHPFNDGNGRTARLAMNLILIRGGYPPVAVRPEDRPSYIGALQQAQSGHGTEALDALLYERLHATLGEYLSVLRDTSNFETEHE
ncbi:MAG: Fic family protein [Bryobacteraceae bacterium]